MLLWRTSRTPRGNTTQSIELKLLTKEGYTFTGWVIITNTSGGASSVSDINILTIPGDAYGDITLQESWAINNHIISVQVYSNTDSNKNIYSLDTDGMGGRIKINGGEESGEIYEVVIYNTQVNLKAVEKNDYYFEGWYDAVTGELVTDQTIYSLTVPDKDINLVAKFTKKDYTVLIIVGISVGSLSVVGLIIYSIVKIGRNRRRSRMGKRVLYRNINKIYKKKIDE